MKVKKPWAPTMEEMRNAIKATGEVETIVLESFTREAFPKSVEEMNKGIRETIEVALAKAKNVVVSTIIAREDEDDIQDKINLINANTKYAFKGNDRVFICDNTNLNDTKFRPKDQLHLSDHGTAVFANNLKYKIAESLGVTVKKKNRSSYGYDNTHNSYYNYNN